MFSLQDILGQEQGEQAVGQMSQQIGAEPSVVNSAISMALPMIVGAVAQRATQPAVQNEIVNNDGGILDNVGGFLGNSNLIQSMGGGLLSTILGGGQSQVAQQVSNQSGLSMGQTASLMAMLAPLVMSYFGRQQSNQGLDAGGIIGMLTGQQQQIQQQQPGLMGMLGGMLDRNHDGSSVDDLMGLAGQFLNRR